MALVGYARVSSVGQSLDVQLARLKDCDRIFQEKRSGTNMDRPELDACLRYLRAGDTLVVTKMDRIARSTADLYGILAKLDEADVALRVMDDPLINTESRSGKLLLGILALIAEFENDLRRERQMDGIANAKRRGVRFGPEPKLSTEGIKRLRRLRASGTPVSELAAESGLSRATVYRVTA